MTLCLFERLIGLLGTLFGEESCDEGNILRSSFSPLLPFFYHCSLHLTGDSRVALVGKRKRFSSRR